MLRRTTSLMILALVLIPLGVRAQDRPRRPRPSVDEVFERRDRNGDGRLTADELSGRASRLLEADADGDGAVTKEELGAFRERRRGGRRGDRQPPREDEPRSPAPSGPAVSGEGRTGMVQIRGGTFEMGDHHDLGGREHPSDEIPLHTVRVSTFSISATEVTNREYVAFLNAARKSGTITVRDGLVRSADGATVYCDTRSSDRYSRIGDDGRHFSVLGGKEDHPATGIRWHGAAAYTNWLSRTKGLPALYDPKTWTCTLEKRGYRLPTEAEWEYAARGGSHPPYLVFPWGNAIDPKRANLPKSGDPFESGPFPHTTPVGFYDGSVRKKADFAWPGRASTYATSNGANGYGLYDMAGNVWEWCHDWYGRDAYASAAGDNPTGPARGTTMPDRRRYHVMRGGNWYNGSDGHARTANRNNGHYRGPDDPNHSWYHVGFRVVLSDGVASKSRNDTTSRAEGGDGREGRRGDREGRRGRWRDREDRPRRGGDSGRRGTGSRAAEAGSSGTTTQRVGLIANTPAAFPGYTLFAPKHHQATYLMDNAGRVVNSWKSRYEPGQSVYLLPNGHLLYTCFTKEKGFIHGGEGGRIEEYDWDGNLVWEFDYRSDRYLSHHDIEPLPNGNILLLAVERRTRAECVAAGFDPARLRENHLCPDTVVEVQKTGKSGGRIVWEWRVWDHLIQDRDRTKANYGDPAAHPERIDISGDDRRGFAAFWNHMNSIDYHPEFDQILLSVRGNNEIWIIDHGTTTAQAAGHSGGKYGRGGDLLYRWGNPAQYRAGSSRDQQLFDQHDARWIDPGSPGAGNILIFNNGNRRGWSSVVEIVPPVSAKGRYRLARGDAFGPMKPTWEYAAKDRKSFYSEAISGAQRLPNGNTLICDGTHGRLFEVTADGETVWDYVNPVVREGPLAAGESPGLDHRRHQWNAVFKVDRYAADFPGFADRDLEPGNPLLRPASEGRTERGEPDRRDSGTERERRDRGDRSSRRPKRDENARERGDRRGGPSGGFHTDVPVHLLDIVLGRPAAGTVTVSILASEALVGRVEYGVHGGDLSRRTKMVRFPAGVPVEVTLDDLRPDTRYAYRFRYQRSDALDETPLRSFRTPRSPGGEFTFTIQADSHLDANTDPEMYARTLTHAAKDAPDFHVDLGDTFMVDKRGDHRESEKQYFAQRYYFGLLCHSSPLFLTLGNHDGERGGRRGAEMAAWSASMRHKHFPSPSATGYYAFTWGDALVVVLDPFRYAARRSARGNRDGWDQTLGEAQYRWLETTLAESRARHRFVFVHNLVGGLNGQSRGGAEASHLYEWGGRGADGVDAFETKRPGWTMPIHDLLVKHGVSVVFHGHDHFFARQERDGLVYQLVPQPGNPRARADRLAEEYGYESGKILSGSGYLRVRVTSEIAVVEFVKVDPADGEPRGEVACRYEIAARRKGR